MGSKAQRQPAERSSAIELSPRGDLTRLSRFALAGALGVALLRITACGLEKDKDGDGYFDSPELAGTALFDCYPDDPDLHLGMLAYRDEDRDGMGDRTRVCVICISDTSATPTSVDVATDVPCEKDVQYVFNDFDCNDGDATLREGREYYRDADGDGLGDPNPALTAYACPLGPDDSPPLGYVSNADDCNDSFASQELQVKRYFFDGDTDTFGGSEFYESCSAVPAVGYVTSSTDCNDADATVNPAVKYDCLEDGVERDNDCDGKIDEDEGATWYPDADGDGFGRSGEGRKDCVPLPGYVAVAGDCNDNDPGVYPGTEECPFGE